MGTEKNECDEGLEKASTYTRDAEDLKGDIDRLIGSDRYQLRQAAHMVIKQSMNGLCLDQNVCKNGIKLSKTRTRN